MKLIQKQGFTQNQFQSRMAAQRPCRQRGSWSRTYGIDNKLFWTIRIFTTDSSRKFTKLRSAIRLGNWTFSASITSRAAFRDKIINKDYLGVGKGRKVNTRKLNLHKIAKAFLSLMLRGVIEQFKEILVNLLKTQCEKFVFWVYYKT